MVKRLQLHDELVEILGTDNVYFQPPENVKLKYPCIVYKRSNPNTEYADNKVYTYKQGYDITVIYDDPDMSIGKDILMHFQYCKMGTTYTADNLYHDPLTLYY